MYGLHFEPGVLVDDGRQRAVYARDLVIRFILTVRALFQPLVENVPAYVFFIPQYLRNGVFAEGLPPLRFPSFGVKLVNDEAIPIAPVRTG